MISKNAKGLSEFAEEDTSPKKRCLFCRIPESDEINAGYVKGVPIATISRWLIKEKGYSPDDVNEDKVRRHFRSRHGVS